MIKFVKRWWRPFGYYTIVTAVLVNTVVIPWSNKVGINLKDLAIVMAAFAPLAGLRTYERLKDPDDRLGQ